MSEEETNEPQPDVLNQIFSMLSEIIDDQKEMKH